MVVGVGDLSVLACLLFCVIWCLECESFWSSELLFFHICVSHSTCAHLLWGSCGLFISYVFGVELWSCNACISVLLGIDIKKSCSWGPHFASADLLCVLTWIIPSSKELRFVSFVNGFFVHSAKEFNSAANFDVISHAILINILWIM